jgi:hypothetical protein
LPLYICARFRFPPVSLGGGHLLVEGVGVGLLVVDSAEVLAVDVGELAPVAGVGEEHVARTSPSRGAQGYSPPPR